MQPATNIPSKTVLITGAAKRIGRVIALRLAAHGWDIAAHYNKSKNEAESLAHEIQNLGRRAIILQADLNDSAQTKNLVPNAAKQLGPIRLLVNNASLFERDRIDSMSEQSLLDHCRVNLLAPIELMQEMAAQAVSRAQVINLLDHTILKNPRGFASYNLSKTALWTATQMAARQWADKLSVNAVAPGIVLPPGETAETQEWREPYVDGAVSHHESADDIAAACLMLAENPNLTGQMLTIDAGRHLYPHRIMKKA